MVHKYTAFTTELSPIKEQLALTTIQVVLHLIGVVITFFGFKSPL